MNAVLAYLGSNDLRVSGRLADWVAPHWFMKWMMWASRLGDGWLWAVIALCLLVLGDFAALLAALLSCGLANAAMIALKKRYRRSRPRPAMHNAFFKALKADLSGFDDFSFPSGHTMNAFAIGTALSVMFPALLPSMLFLAGNVAASRVVLRMHFLTDVIVGALLGMLIGLLVCLGFSK